MTKTPLLLATLLFAASIFTGSTAHAGACTDAWDESEAADYCTANVGRVSAGTGTGNCTLGISCSIAVDVDDVSVTYTPSRYTTQSIANTKKMDICFRVSDEGTAGFQADIEVGCPYHYQTDSDTAVSDGLSTD